MAETFKCPSCAAPLDFEGTPMQKCRFCGNSVIVPRDVVSDSTSFGGVGVVDFSDLSALTGKALKIAEIQSLLQQQRRIEAIKLFRETFGSGLAEAKEAVERIERGESIDLSGIAVRRSQPQATVLSGADGAKIAKAMGYTIGGSILGTMLIVFIIIGAVIALTFFVVSRSLNKVMENPIATRATPPGETQSKSATKASIAQEVFRFGGEGNGAGKFTDNRTVAVDADGRIYTADRTGGRIQVFDSNGNFQKLFTADTTRSVDKLMVDRAGTLFVLQGYDLFRLNRETGETLGKTRVGASSDAALGLDGKIYVAARFGPIAVLNSDGSVFKTITPSKDLGIQRIEKIAVDGGGNLFILEGRSNAVFRLGPDANLLGRFEVTATNSGKSKFTGSSQDLAIDSVGRLYLSQVSRIAIFDANGNFVNEFETKQAFGMAFNDKDEIFVASRPFVVKLKVTL